MSTAKAELRRPTGVGCSELLGAWVTTFIGIVISKKGV